MSDPTATSARQWNEANQRHLMAAVGLATARLERMANEGGDDRVREAETALGEATAALAAPSALQVITRRFALSGFERDLLVLCAGVELDRRCAQACASAQGDPRKTQATFSLALAALPDPHWSALTPSGPLRRWRLLSVGEGPALTTSPLRIEERPLHALAGVNYLAERLQGLVRPVPPPASLAASHEKLAEHLRQVWDQSPEQAVMLSGADAGSKGPIVALACHALGCHLFALRAADIPLLAAEREDLARTWEREAALQNSALLIEIDDAASHDHLRATQALVAGLHGWTAVAIREPADGWWRPLCRLEVERPSSAEQCLLWGRALARFRTSFNGRIEQIAEHFALAPDEIAAAAAESMAAPDAAAAAERLWTNCRQRARTRLEELAQRIESAVGWADLVLPEQPLTILHEIAAQVRQRFQVYERWGFGAKLARGLGVTALFAGGSGTGKTMAAEVLANDLCLDLYRIDLSAVVSKYVGETEKNLRRVFDAAEAGGAILLFDEADALFGKRSEVRDSHDRYANIEVSYLLQRMEAYRGLAILTTNLKSVLDPAFLRRLRFVVQFPFPDAAQRAEIWRRVFPRQTPTASIRPERLAQLNVPGGNIRNIALNAAFLAAESKEPVRMHHLLAAARTEYAKLEKPLTGAEIGGWE